MEKSRRALPLVALAAIRDRLAVRALAAEPREMPACVA